MATKSERLAVAEAQLTAITAALDEVGAGVMSVTIDGMTTQLDRAGLLDEYNLWNKKVLRLQRSGARAQGINLSGAHG